MTPSTKKTTLRSQDLNCPSCVPKIESALNHLDCVSYSTFHFNTVLIANHEFVAFVDQFRQGKGFSFEFHDSSKNESPRMAKREPDLLEGFPLFAS